MKLESVYDQNNNIIEGYLTFYCFGCKCDHFVWVNKDGAKSEGRWAFNCDFESPTISPSILVTYPHPKGFSNDNPAPFDYQGECVIDKCHFFIENGIIKYLQDCTHELAGQELVMKNIQKKPDKMPGFFIRYLIGYSF